MLLDIEKLESVLVAHWTEFIDVHNAILFCRKSAEDNLCFKLPLKISELLITRFCPKSDNHCFLVWFEYSVSDLEHKAKVTTECTVDFEGILKHIRTIEEFRQHQDA